MRFIVMLFLLFGTCAMAQENPAQPIGYEGLTVYESLPQYVYLMERPVYVKWAKLQNKGAYREAQRLADDWQIRNPSIDVYVQTYDTETRTTQGQNETVSPNGAQFGGQNQTNIQGKNVQQVFRPDGWGGGPVTLINPFADRPPRLVRTGPNNYKVLDPDMVFQSQEEINDFIEKELNE